MPHFPGQRSLLTNELPGLEKEVKVKKDDMNSFNEEAKILLATKKSNYQAGSSENNNNGLYQRLLNSQNSSACTPNNYWQLIKHQQYVFEDLVKYHFFSTKEKACANALFDGYDAFSKKYSMLGQSKLELLNSSLGAFIGGLIGDSYGSLTEFALPDYSRAFITDFEKKYYEMKDNYNIINHCELKFGQWSDDSSMSMCIADSLIDLMAYDDFDIKTRFFAWMNKGYDNAFKYDNERKYKRSVGLGATIGQSLFNFCHNPVNLSAIKKGADNAICTY